MIFNLQHSPHIGNHILGQLRNIQTQQDRSRFRHNLRRLGGILACELSRSLDYDMLSIETPLGFAQVQVPARRVVVASILRAGLPMQEGVIDVFEDADAAFISAYRKHRKDGSFEISLEYLTCPDLNGSVLILVDPMVATGSSTALALQHLKAFGQPHSTHLIAAVVAREGIEHLERVQPDLHMWVAAIDEELTARAYIVPGLGDAGDLCFGPKLQS